MAKFGESSDVVKCSFCAKPQAQVRKLIAGPGVYICNECIEICEDIIRDEGLLERQTSVIPRPTKDGPASEEDASTSPRREDTPLPDAVGPALRSIRREMHDLADRLATSVERVEPLGDDL